MTHPKLILITTLVASTLLFVGCTTTSKVNTNTADTNVTANMNVVVDNTNTVVVKNDNSNENVDTSDWQTYTNDEYGFSFKYPSGWGAVQATTGDIAPFLLVLNFRDENNKQQDVVGNPRFVISNNVAEGTSASDANSWFDYSKVDFAKTNDQLAQDLHRNLTETIVVEKITIGIKPALKITEGSLDLDGSKTNTLHILITNFDGQQNNMTMSGDTSISDTFLQIANTLDF